MARVTDKQFREAVRAVKKELRAAEAAWSDLRMGPYGSGKTIVDVYAALERTQHAAFDAKHLVAPEPARAPVREGHR